jgi:hypothetical protein
MPVDRNRAKFGRPTAQLTPPLWDESGGDDNKGALNGTPNAEDADRRDSLDRLPQSHVIS